TTLFFLLTHTPTTHTSTLSLHDALPISPNSTMRLLARFSWPWKESRDVHPRPRPWFARVSTIWRHTHQFLFAAVCRSFAKSGRRSEEHTSELQSRGHLVCRLLLEKKKYV